MASTAANRPDAITVKCYHGIKPDLSKEELYPFMTSWQAIKSETVPSFKARCQDELNSLGKESLAELGIYTAYVYSMYDKFAASPHLL
jgi:hypothetical protein